MAIVEDEVRNESEEDNDIEVVVEEDDAEQDSEVSDDDDDEEALEKKVSDLELRIANDPYSYNEHIELIEALWRLSELDRWRAAFDRLQNLSLLQAEHWLLRLQTEVTLGHSSNSREQIIALFEQATLDCYSIPILSEWCTWCTCLSDNTEMVRAQLDEVLRRAGPDPLSGKIFWDAKFEFEQAQLEAMNESDPGYKEQKGRVIYCLEEVVSRPLLRSVEALPQFQEMASAIHGDEYVEKVKRQHDRSVEFVEALTPYEDKLLTAETAEEKYKIYQDYIDTVKAFSEDDKFAECDCNGILRVLYDRATHECSGHALHTELLRQFADFTLRSASRSTCSRVIKACCRRAPRCVAFCVLRMQCEEKYGATLEEIKSIFESALSRGTDSYKDAESLWLAYLEFIRRHTAFDNEADVERLRKTFRLAWDSLAEAWGVEANDCEIPLFWARLEYKLMKDSKQGKEIFEELFKYGENKTMAKYWEQLIQLELIRQPPLSENKVRDLFRRALKFVQDYPPSVVRVWTDYERDYGQLSQLRECQEACEAKLKEWRENYQTMKEKMTGKKHKGKTDNKQMNNKKDKPQSHKFEKKTQNKGKRKSDESQEGSQVKRKKDIVDVEMVDKNSSSGLKRTHDGSDKTEASGSKRPKTDSASSGPVQEGREACTLFVSNLEFKVDEQKLRDKLSEYGDIVSMRVRAGVKAFGGSICYCQYKTPESVDEAIKHDRTPIEGRPMFLSRYSSNKSSKTFKYATTTEKNKLFVKNLPFASCSKDALAEIFDKYGNLKDVRIVTYKDGKPKGFAYIEFEDESSASNALDKTNGLLVGDRKIEVAISAPPSREDGATPALGQSKREQSGGMRRTQLSSFIPSVLQRATTSKAANGNHSNGDDNKPMSNSDFRNMLLKK